jgi:hypothetical protein
MVRKTTALQVRRDGPENEANGDGERPTAWLGRQDSNLCISVSEFSKTLSSGREDTNIRISLASWSCRTSLLRKSQAMTSFWAMPPRPWGHGRSLPQGLPHTQPATGAAVGPLLGFGPLLCGR